MRAKFRHKRRAVAGRIPLVIDAVAAYIAAIDSMGSTRVKGALLAALAFLNDQKGELPG